MECLNHLVMTIWGFASEAPSTAKQAIFESVLGAWTIWCTEFMWPKRVFFFSRDKGVLVVPVLYKDCEKFHVYKEISSRTNQYAWDDRRLFKTPHTSFTMLLLHFPSDFETPDQFLWFFNRFLTGRDDVTIKDIKGADKGRGDDLECWPRRSYVPMNSTLAHGKLRTWGLFFCQTQMLKVWWVYLPYMYPQKPSKWK